MMSKSIKVKIDWDHPALARALCRKIGALLVPRYVVRIDSGSTHGWQVRFFDTKGKAKSWLFSDGEGLPNASLKQAISQLISVWENKPAAKTPTKELSSKSRETRTGQRGIRFDFPKRRLEATSHYGKAPKRIPLKGEYNSAGAARESSEYKEALSTLKAWRSERMATGKIFSANGLSP